MREDYTQLDYFFPLFLFLKLLSFPSVLTLPLFTTFIIPFPSFLPFRRRRTRKREREREKIALSFFLSCNTSLSVDSISILVWKSVLFSSPIYVSLFIAFISSPFLCMISLSLSLSLYSSSLRPPSQMFK